MSEGFSWREIAVEMQFRNTFSTAWLRRLCHDKGVHSGGIIHLLLRVGAVRRISKGTFAWNHGVSVSDAMEALQVWLVCMDDDLLYIAPALGVRRDSVALLEKCLEPMHFGQYRRTPQYFGYGEVRAIVERHVDTVPKTIAYIVCETGLTRSSVRSHLERMVALGDAMKGYDDNRAVYWRASA